MCFHPSICALHFITLFPISTVVFALKSKTLTQHLIDQTLPDDFTYLFNPLFDFRVYYLLYFV